MDLIALLIYIVVIALVAGLALYVIQSLVPDAQIVRVCRVVIVVLVCLAIIYLLLGALPPHGHPLRLGESSCTQTADYEWECDMTHRTTGEIPVIWWQD